MFLPTVRKHTCDPVALVVDGFSGHSENVSDPMGQVKVFKFPPNVTSVYQPLDQGIIAALKAGYKSRLLTKVVATADCYVELQVRAKQLPAGSAGLQYGCPPHVGDAVTLLKEAWDNISPSTIAACWGHARCLPALDSTNLDSDTQDYSRNVEMESIQSMCSSLSKLSLTNPNVGSMLDDLGLSIVANVAPETVFGKANEMLLEWLHIEDVGMIDATEEDESDCLAEGSKDNIQLLHEALPLLEKLHSVGARISDPYIMDAARDLCAHIRDVTSAMQ